MNIRINNQEVTVAAGQTLLAAARSVGIHIPALCFAEGAHHRPSCMACAVKDCQTGQIIPACATMPTDGMQIDTESAEVRGVRTLSIELLLSDHRADCEAPCTLVCPHGLDVEQALAAYDAADTARVRRLIAAAFIGSEPGCLNCKAPCEKACRRGTVDKPVAIREIMLAHAEPRHASAAADAPPPVRRKPAFNARLGRFTDAEKERLKADVRTESRCLHCACAGYKGCKLRLLAAQAGIRRSRYEAASELPAMRRQVIGERLYFEPAKCIRCGLCVYNSVDGFAFKSRGFSMEIVLPDENIPHIDRRLADLCPTGAIYES